MQTAAGYGKLREPALFLTGAARALGTASDGVYLAQQARNLGQDVFNAPTVFNYYPPDYVIPGTALFGPEFALQNASTAISRYNVRQHLGLRHHSAPVDASRRDRDAAELGVVAKPRGQSQRVDT